MLLYLSELPKHKFDSVWKNFNKIMEKFCREQAEVTIEIILEFSVGQYLTSALLDIKNFLEILSRQNYSNLTNLRNSTKIEKVDFL